MVVFGAGYQAMQGVWGVDYVGVGEPEIGWRQDWSAATDGVGPAGGLWSR